MLDRGQITCLYIYIVEVLVFKSNMFRYCDDYLELFTVRVSDCFDL